MKNKCWICGKEYDACLNCKDMNGWRRTACSPEHYQINQIIRETKEGIISDKEATELFANIGITADSELELLPEITRRIKIIIANGTPKRITKPKNKSNEEVDDE